MATVHELADTLGSLRNEMGNRVDEMVKSGNISMSAAASLGGILEWMGSLEEAMRACNGKPTSDRIAHEAMTGAVPEKKPRKK